MGVCENLLTKFKKITHLRLVFPENGSSLVRYRKDILSIFFAGLPGGLIPGFLFDEETGCLFPETARLFIASKAECTYCLTFIAFIERLVSLFLQP